MTDLRKAAQQALEALERCAVKIEWEWGDCRDLKEMRRTGEYTEETTAAITALKAALAEPECYDQTALELCGVCGWRTLIPNDACLNCERAKPEQKPVAWMDEFGNVFPFSAQRGPKYLNEPMKPLYTAPTPRKPLTDEEMRECAQSMNAEPLAEGWPELIKFARAIEKAHGIGEQT